MLHHPTPGTDPSLRTGFLTAQAPVTATLATDKHLPALHQEYQQTEQEEKETMTLCEK